MISRAMARLEKWIDRHFIGFTVTLLFVLFILVFFARNIFITIPAGHGGALWLRFFGGTVKSFAFGEGTKVIFPWDKIYLYDLRIQQQTTEVDVLTNEGLGISVEITARFRLNPVSLGPVTALAGPDYVRTLLLPTLSAMVRNIASQYTVEEIYSTKRHEIEDNILQVARKAVFDLILESPEADILLQDLWFRSIKLPPYLQSAIEGKLTQAQMADQYRFILLREEREKERKLIEAQGIKGFQDIVSSGISENYLRWKGIDATLKLSESNNAKIVIVGGGKEGLPIILGPLDSGTSGQTVQPPASAGTKVAPALATPPGMPRDSPDVPRELITPPTTGPGSATGQPSESPQERLFKAR